MIAKVMIINVLTPLVTESVVEGRHQSSDNLPRRERSFLEKMTLKKKKERVPAKPTDLPKKPFTGENLYGVNLFTKDLLGSIRQSWRTSGFPVSRVDGSKGGIEAQAFQNRKAVLIAGANQKYGLRLRPHDSWCPLMQAMYNAGIKVPKAFDQEVSSLCKKGAKILKQPIKKCLSIDMYTSYKVCNTDGLTEGVVSRMVATSGEDRPDLSFRSRFYIRPGSTPFFRNSEKLKPAHEVDDWDLHGRWKLPYAAALVSHRHLHFFNGVEIGYIVGKSKDDGSQGQPSVVEAEEDKGKDDNAVTKGAIDSPSDVIMAGCNVDAWTPLRAWHKHGAQLLLADYSPVIEKSRDGLYNDLDAGGISQLRETARRRVGSILASNRVNYAKHNPANGVVCDYKNHFKVNVNFFKQDIKKNGDTSIFVNAQEIRPLKIERGANSWETKFGPNEAKVNQSFLGSILESSAAEIRDYDAESKKYSDRLWSENELRKVIIEESIQKMEDAKKKGTEIADADKYNEVIAYYNFYNIKAVVMVMAPMESFPGKRIKSTGDAQYEKLDGRDVYKQYKVPDRMVLVAKNIKKLFNPFEQFSKHKIPLVFVDPQTQVLFRYDDGIGDGPSHPEEPLPGAEPYFGTGRVDPVPNVDPDASVNPHGTTADETTDKGKKEHKSCSVGR